MIRFIRTSRLYSFSRYFMRVHIEPGTYSLADEFDPVATYLPFAVVYLLNNFRGTYRAFVNVVNLIKKILIDNYNDIFHILGPV